MVNIKQRILAYIKTLAVTPHELKYTEIKSYKTLKAMLTGYHRVNLAWYPDYILAWDALAYSFKDYCDAYNEDPSKFLEISIDNTVGNYEITIPARTTPRKMRSKALFKKIFNNVRVQFLDENSEPILEE